MQPFRNKSSIKVRENLRELIHSNVRSSRRSSGVNDSGAIVHGSFYKTPNPNDNDDAS